MAAQEIKVPDIGDFDSVEVIEVLVAAGDSVEQEQALITLESDKATLEVPSTAAGTVTEVKVGEGDSVSEGDVIALVDVAEAGAGGDASPDAGASEAAGSDATTASAPAAQSRGGGAKASGSAGAAGGGENVEVKVPDIGDFDSVEVIEVLVSAGDPVEQEQALITLESDKATLEVPSTAAGTVSEVKVGEGDTVSEGDVIALVATAGGGQAKPAGDASQQSQPDQAPQHSEASSSEDQPEQPAPSPPSSGDSSDTSRLAPVDESAFSNAHASPSVRRLARQLGAELGRIEGSGRKGRVVEQDVQRYVKQTLDRVQRGGQAPAAGGAGGGLPAQPDMDFSQFGETETVELSRIRKVSARAVHNNWLLIPHVTQFESADITEMEAFRQANKEAAAKDDVKLTPLAFLLKASAAALKAFPDLNSSLAADGEHLIQKHYCHVAVAVDTPNGLLMPVIRDCDTKGIYQLARDLDDVSSRARDGKLKSNDMKGACFSISSLGGVGGSAFTPIVNSPEVGILGVSKHSWQPVWQDGHFVPRLLLPLSFSYDHRVIDGAEAARITNFISRSLGDLRTLLL